MQKLKDLRYYLIIYVILFFILVIQTYTEESPNPTKKISKKIKEHPLESTAKLWLWQSSLQTVAHSPLKK